MPAVSIIPTTGYSPVVGVQRRITIPNPAPGSDWSLTLPGGAYWRLLSLRAIFTASAVVASRIPRFQTLDGAAIINTTALTQSVAASAVQEYVLAKNVPIILAAVPGVPNQIPYLDWFLPAGYIIRASTFLIDAGDQWSAIESLFEEVDLGPYGETLGMVQVSANTPSGGE